MSTIVSQQTEKAQPEGTTRTSYFDDGSRMRFIILTENTVRLEMAHSDGSIALSIDFIDERRPAAR